MTRFLRFEIGGASALLWAFLFLGPYLNVAELLSIDAVKFLSFVFGSAVLSIPLGNYIHQVTDTLFNPFRKWRLFFFRRAAVMDIQELLRTEKAGRDHTFQAVLVFCKAISREEKLSSVDPKKEIITKFDAAVLREEISNRYSYYYARIENGVIAPVLGGAFAAFAYRLFCTTSYVLSEPKFSVWWVVSTGVIVGVLMGSRVVKLFQELDDLEVALVRLQHDCWPDVSSRAPVAGPQ